jgi:hypothetical protein
MSICSPLSHMPLRSAVDGVNRNTLAILLTLSWLGCAVDDRSTRLELQVRDSAAIQIVENAPAALSHELEWLIAAEPVVRLGVLDGAGPEAFTSLRSAFRLSNGRLVVLGGGDPELAVFEPSGSFLYGIGRRGQGPGEWRRAAAAFPHTNDTIVVYDAPGWMLHFFESDGAYTRSVRMEMPAQATPPMAAYSDGAGHITVQTFYSPDLSNSGELHAVHRFYGYRVADGSLLTELSLDGGALAQHGVDLGPAGGPAWLRHPMSAAGGGHLITGTGRALHFTVWSDSGTAIRMFRVLETDISEGSPPAFGAMLIDSEGYLWVRELGQLDERGRPDVSNPNATARWWILDSSGALRGGIDLDAAMHVLSITENEIVASRTDSFGVPYLEVFTLQRTQR